MSTVPTESHATDSHQAHEASVMARLVDRSRRNFLLKLSLAMNGIVGAALAVPILGYLLGPHEEGSAQGRLDRPRLPRPISRGRNPPGHLPQSHHHPLGWPDRRGLLLGPPHRRRKVPGLRHQLRPPGLPRALVRRVQALHVPLPRRAPTTRMARAPRVRPNAASSNTSTRSSITRCRSTSMDCPRSPPRPACAIPWSRFKARPAARAGDADARAKRYRRWNL